MYIGAKEQLWAKNKSEYTEASNRDPFGLGAKGLPSIQGTR